MQNRPARARSRLARLMDRPRTECDTIINFASPSATSPDFRAADQATLSPLDPGVLPARAIRNRGLLVLGLFIIVVRLPRSHQVRHKLSEFLITQLTHAAAELLVIATVDLTGFRDEPRQLGIFRQRTPRRGLLGKP